MTGNNRGMVLQERDEQLLRELSVMRIMDRDQAMHVAGFGSTTRVNCRLLKLSRAGFLRRFFLGTVGGARKAIYSLSPAGAALVGVPYRGLRRANDQTLAADFFVTHQLWINEVYCLLKHRAIPVDGAHFVRWISFHEPLTPNIALIPDGYAELATPEKKLAMFLEVDLGHESRSVWQKKIRAYLAYAESGNFTTQFGERQFRTLVLTPSERRMHSLRGATAAITDKIFWFATLEATKADGFWKPVWCRAKDDSRQALL